MYIPQLHDKAALGSRVLDNGRGIIRRGIIRRGVIRRGIIRNDLYSMILFSSLMSSLCLLGCSEERASSSLEALGDAKDLSEPMDLDFSVSSSEEEVGDGDRNLDSRFDAEVDSNEVLDHGHTGSPTPLRDCLSLEVIQRNLPPQEGESSTISMVVPACQSPQLNFALPRGSRWRLELTLSRDHEMNADSLSRSGQVAIYDTLGWAKRQSPDPSISDRVVIAERRLEESLVTQVLAFDIDVQQSGRHVLVIEKGGNSPPTQSWSQSIPYDLNLSLSCISGCHLHSTLYPIVLIHGYAGVDEYFGFLDYFYRVPQHLRAQGFGVLVPSLSPIEQTSIRGRELSHFLDQAQAQQGYEKFNLIAHSQGGLDGRYLISQLEEFGRISTLTTIATPHFGIPISLVNFFSEQDFSLERLETFNRQTPDHPDVHYFSWSARSCTLVELSCIRAHDGELVTPFLLPTYTLLKAFGPNDGLVPTESMRYGEHLGTLSADHFDQIGQIADEDRGAFNHRVFYLNEAQRLRSLGF